MKRKNKEKETRKPHAKFHFFQTNLQLLADLIGIFEDELRKFGQNQKECQFIKTLKK